mgnify:CR=1 FL=1
MLNPQSVPGKVVQESLHGSIVPIVNENILWEYDNVLYRPKFKFNPDSVKILLDDLQKRAIFSKEAEINDILSDPNDTVFFAVLSEIRKYKPAYSFIPTSFTSSCVNQSLT